MQTLLDPYAQNADARPSLGTKTRRFNPQKLSDEEQLDFLLAYLYAENKTAPRFPDIKTLLAGNSLPSEWAKLTADQKKHKLRALINLRPPRQVSRIFSSIEQYFLKNCLKQKGLVEAETLPCYHGFYLYQGDITLIKAGAIVNAANATMLGCFIPGHNCIDNCIHSAAGVELRAYCDREIKKLHRTAKTAEVLVSPAFALPARYILHVTGPITTGRPTEQDCLQLAACYKNCLQQALELKLKSIVFCCLSTGVFAFPKRQAACIAINTCLKAQKQTLKAGLKVIFNVFDPENTSIYQQELERLPKEHQLD